MPRRGEGSRITIGCVKWLLAGVENPPCLDPAPDGLPQGSAVYIGLALYACRRIAFAAFYKGKSEFHARTFGHTAFGQVTYRQLLRHDAPGAGFAGEGRDVSLHRELPCADVGVRRGVPAHRYARRGPRFPRVRLGPQADVSLPAERCSRSDRAELDPVDDHAHGSA